MFCQSTKEFLSKHSQLPYSDTRSIRLYRKRSTQVCGATARRSGPGHDRAYEAEGAVAGVREQIEAAGARLIYLPPYSPDFNPIEQAWSKVKQVLRSLKARTADALETAVAEALAAITPENAIAWFSHCGYGLQ